MMQFLRDRHERQFQLAFNRGAIRGDIIYSICLAVFGLSTTYRLRGTPDAGSAVSERGGGSLHMPVGLLACLEHVPLMSLEVNPARGWQTCCAAWRRLAGGCVHDALVSRRLCGLLICPCSCWPLRWCLHMRRCCFSWQRGGPPSMCAAASPLWLP